LKGIQQAKEAGKILCDKFKEVYGEDETKFPHIRLWVSPFKRTRQTAELVAAVGAIKGIIC